MNWPVIISAVLGLLSTVAAAALGYLAKRAESHSADRKYISEDFRETIERLDTENIRLRTRIDTLEERDRQRQIGEIELRADLAQVQGFAERMRAENKELKAKVLVQDREIGGLRDENRELKTRVLELERLNGAR